MKDGRKRESDFEPTITNLPNLRMAACAACLCHSPTTRHNSRDRQITGLKPALD